MYAKGAGAGRNRAACPGPDGLTDDYSALTKLPFSPHLSHFWGLQRPSLVNPQVHFQVAMIELLSGGDVVLDADREFSVSSDTMIRGYRRE